MDVSHDISNYIAGMEYPRSLAQRPAIPNRYLPFGVGLPPQAPPTPFALPAYSPPRMPFPEPKQRSIVPVSDIAMQRSASSDNFFNDMPPNLAMYAQRRMARLAADGTTGSQVSKAAAPAAPTTSLYQPRSSGFGKIAAQEAKPSSASLKPNYSASDLISRHSLTWTLVKDRPTALKQQDPFRRDFNNKMRDLSAIEYVRFATVSH